ncbi:patatin-like phospholipase family protein [Arenibacter latericius]|uniref:patatin-like phospholipase family protein n=1 Tax=Arenibacter latericius TaxID=86104 RepID=UPI000427E2D3|nr:patatin-like phospholipase family protein [Arenibacter latericius]MDX1365843.1 patatin-like phospholipase family protein [Arenibacter latericius]
MNLEGVKSKSIGLVLSGGGVKGMAHIGLIQALNEFGIQAQLVSGSSVGALVGAMYANGNSVSEMLNFFKETPLFRYHFMTIVKPGLLDTERYFDVLLKYFPKNTFEALERKLYVITTDLQRGEERVFGEGELIRPLLASAALPPVFSPVEIDGTIYADGGIMNNFPYYEVANKVDYVIGSNLMGIRVLSKEGINSSYQLTNRTTSLMMYANNRIKVKKCDLLFEPNDLDLIGILDKKGIEKAYTIGYEHALKKLQETFVEV